MTSLICNLCQSTLCTRDRSEMWDVQNTLSLVCFIKIMMNLEVVYSWKDQLEIETGQAVSVWSNVEVRWRNHSCRGKATSITYTGSVFVALAIQRGKRMGPIVLSSVACPPLRHFSALSHERHDFRKNLFNTKCVFCWSLQLMCNKFIIPRRILRDIVNLRRFSLKYSLFLLYFHQIWIFPTD
jgi:hypothetical protein